MNSEDDPFSGDAASVIASSSEESNKLFLAQTIIMYGPTIRQMPSGRAELNDASLSRILARSLELAYDAAGQEFLSTTEPAQRLTEVQVIRLVTDRLLQIAAQLPDTFPTHELRPGRIKKLVAAIKLIAVVYRPDAQSGLEQFVRESLVLRPGCDVTIAEIHIAYLEFARRQGTQVYPLPTFQRMLSKLILNSFRKTRSNSLQRSVSGTEIKTYRRGYKGLALVDSYAKNEDDGDGRDGGDEVFGNPAFENPS